LHDRVTTEAQRHRGTEAQRKPNIEKAEFEKAEYQIKK
jgi:hypothetical protein